MKNAVLLGVAIGATFYMSAFGEMGISMGVPKHDEQPTVVESVMIDSCTGVELLYSEPYNIESNHLTKSNGSIKYNGHRETWYSIHEPGQTVTARDIPGKHIADDGTIRDAEGYICVATNQRFYKYGDVVMTSVGPGKVYDCGCSYGTVDVYTSW